jgi:hypothetical protein
MYTRSLHKLHIFSQFVHKIEHHSLAATMGVFAVLWLIYTFTIDSQWFMQDSLPSAISNKPLTLLDDPQYAHERDIRSQHIQHSLNQLKRDTGADRTYMFSYHSENGRIGRMMELKVASIFEVVQEGLPHHIQDYQELSRRSWLLLARDNSTTSGFLPGPIPYSYGLELYDVSGRPVGYIGLEYWQEHPMLKGNERPLFQKTAGIIRGSLLEPLQTLKPLEEK